jgi:hypothetical protein
LRAKPRVAQKQEGKNMPALLTKPNLQKIAKSDRSLFRLSSFVATLLSVTMATLFFVRTASADVEYNKKTGLWKITGHTHVAPIYFRIENLARYIDMELRGFENDIRDNNFSHARNYSVKAIKSARFAGREFRLDYMDSEGRSRSISRYHIADTRVLEKLAQKMARIVNEAEDNWASDIFLSIANDAD